MAEKTLMKGNEALAEGAIRAGCRFFAGYPITPQNEVPEYMSWRLPQVGGAFVQAESEVSAINMIYGAGATGVRCMTSSSSPGISLKQEGISYCAGADLPVFIGNVMRGGPGLGNIAGGQGDYWQATRGGGHGDYRTFIMAPNGVNEMANFPRKCFEVSFKYRIPSMVLADGIIGQMMEPVEFREDHKPIKDLDRKDWACTGWRRDGQRARAIVNSLYLDADTLERHNQDLTAKYDAIRENEVRVDGRFLDEDCDLLVVAYGTVARVCLTAIEELRQSGLKVGLIRPVSLYPFPYRAVADAAARAKGVLVVELSTGQMLEDVQLAVQGKRPIRFHGRTGGHLVTPEEAAQHIRAALEGTSREVRHG